jgi:hypothetical protein
METADKRATEFAKFWYGGGNPENAEEDEIRTSNLAREINLLLEEQDRFTRHAIAEAITNEPDEVTPDGTYYNMFSRGRAHNIAMNTRAV